MELNPRPMTTKTDETPRSARTSKVRSCSSEDSSLTAAGPDAILAEILSLLEAEQFKAARKMALEGAARFPEHARLQSARLALAGKAKVGSGGPESGIEKEIRWLENPPAEARGKWVALSGAEMIGCADTPADLLESLRSRKSSAKALVVRVD